MTSYDRSIPLTARQAILIHGWMKPVRRLYWNTHVVARKDLTFAVLVSKMKLSDPTLSSLYQLQPDARQWIQLDKVALQDCEVMHKYWDIHPIRDFVLKDGVGIHEIKISELLAAGLSFEALSGCKVTFTDLAKAGLNADNMRLFDFTLYQWKMLGFQRMHAGCMTSAQSEIVFGMPKNVLEAQFIDH